MATICTATTMPCRPDCVDPCLGCCALQSEQTVRAWGWARRLAVFTVGYNVIEAGVAVASGLAAGSIALVGFGLDSLVESASAVIILWRLAHQTADLAANERLERRAVKLIALSFFALATYVAVDASARVLGSGEPPERSLVGIALTLLSLAIMPLLARSKRQIADVLGSSALRADAAETMICAWLSGVVLGGLLANGILGWWWMDPIAGLAVAAMAVREGREAWNGGELFADTEEESEEPVRVLVCSSVCCPACPAL